MIILIILSVLCSRYNGEFYSKNYYLYDQPLTKTENIISKKVKLKLNYRKPNKYIIQGLFDKSEM